MPAGVMWTQKETETLVSEFCEHKEVLLSPLSATISKKDKMMAWDSIHRNIELKNPGMKKKTIVQTKKKWENLMMEARGEAKKYRMALQGIVDGAPSHVWRRPYFEKIYIDVLGLEIPINTCVKIESGVESESFQDYQDYIPTNTCMKIGVVESESFQDPDTSEAEISQEREIPELIYSEEDSPELITTPNTSGSFNHSNGTPTTLGSKGKTFRQIAVKKTLGESHMENTKKRFLKDRIDMLSSLIDVRNKIGHSVTMDEIPKDLLEAMFNIQNV